MLKKTYVKSRDIGKVTFQLARSEVPEGVEVESVHLVGDFNDWREDETPMKYSKTYKAYRTSVELNPGEEYQFRYLINGQTWCNDWEADAYVPNNLGEDNCVVVSPSGE
jgi:1,4-alpha-glucan branching enzyme